MGPFPVKRSFASVLGATPRTLAASAAVKACDEAGWRASAVVGEAEDIAAPVHCPDNQGI